MKDKYTKPELYLKEVQIEDILSASTIAYRDENLDVFAGVNEALGE